ILDDALGGGLQRAVVARDVLWLWAGGWRWRGRRVLVEPGPRKRSVRGDARNKRVDPDRFGQCLGGGPDDPWEISRGVDHRIPLASGQPADVVLTIALDLLDAGDRRGVGASPVEQRQFVTAPERALHDVATQE